MKAKLTTTEKRAADFCETLKSYNGGSVSVDWADSRTWGANPRIMHRGGKCSNISGCGYDKLSACLAEVLRVLFPMGTEAHSEIAGCSGAGESTVTARLAKHGWTLRKIASGKMYDAYEISRTAEPQPAQS